MRIMVVDNDAALLRSLVILLEGEGHEVAGFACPVRALEHLEGSEAPDLLLVDYVMPAMDGLQFLRAATGRMENPCRAILMSGHGEQLEGVRLPERGVEALLSKPIDLTALRSAILRGEERRTGSGAWDDEDES